MKKVIERFKVSGIVPTISYLFFTVFLEKLGFHVEAVFSIQQQNISKAAEQGYSFRVIQSSAKLGDSDETALLEYGGSSLIDDFEASFARGELCALGYWEQRLGCVCWAKNIQHHPLLENQSAHLIWRCFTLPDLRGRGMYPQTLRFFCAMLSNKDDWPILIECSVFNHASLNGISKAGFQIIGKILRFRKWSRVLAVNNSFSHG